MVNLDLGYVFKKQNNFGNLVLTEVLKQAVNLLYRRWRRLDSALLSLDSCSQRQAKYCSLELRRDAIGNAFKDLANGFERFELIRVVTTRIINRDLQASIAKF